MLDSIFGANKLQIMKIQLVFVFVRMSCVCFSVNTSAYELHMQSILGIRKLCSFSYNTVINSARQDIVDSKWFLSKWMHKTYVFIYFLSQ
jgi:hypothetical protein